METADAIVVVALVVAFAMTANALLIVRACRYNYSQGYKLADTEADVAEHEWRDLLYGLVDTIGAPPCGDSIADAAAEAREAVKGIKAEIEGLQLGIEQQQALGNAQAALLSWYDKGHKYADEDADADDIDETLVELLKALKTAKAEVGG